MLAVFDINLVHRLPATCLPLPHGQRRRKKKRHSPVFYLVYCLIAPSTAKYASTLGWVKFHRMYLIGLRNTTFLGVIVLKHFDPSYGFEVIYFEIAIFGEIITGYLQNCVPSLINGIWIWWGLFSLRFWPKMAFRQPTILCYNKLLLIDLQYWSCAWDIKDCFRHKILFKIYLHFCHLNLFFLFF